MSEDDTENTWMRTVSGMFLLYYCPLSAVSNSHVQRDAAMPLHPLGPAVLPTLLSESKGQDTLTALAGATTPLSHSPHEAPHVVHQQLLLPPFPKEKPCSWETAPTPALLQMMKFEAAPGVQPLHCCSCLKGNISN